METNSEQSKWQDALGGLMGITPADPKIARNPIDAMKILQESSYLPQKNPYKLLFDIMRYERKKSSLARALKRLKTYQKEKPVDPIFSDYAAATLEWIAHRSKLNGFEDFGLKALKIMARLEFENKRSRIGAILDEYERKGLELDVKKLEKGWKAKKPPKKAVERQIRAGVRREVERNREG